MGRNFQEIGWFDLSTLTKYARVSEKTLRAWIKASENPLPASQRGAKIYVNRKVFDQWLQGHPIAPGDTVDRIVEELVSEVRA
jgi:hypothetical protein